MVAQAIAIACAASEAAAHDVKHVAHRYHVWSSLTLSGHAALGTQITRFGAIRYYGGPKYPMWPELK